MIRHRRLPIIIVVILGLAAPVIDRSGSTASWAATQRAAPQSAPKPSETDLALARAERLLAERPNDKSAQKSVAAALLQKAREERDPRIYTRVGLLLAGLGGSRSTDPEVLLLQGTVLLARHEFEEALEVGKRASTVMPFNPSATGILVDAYNELGRYNDALMATQKMVNQSPGLAALARVSYARELRGDLPGAIAAMQQAITAGPRTGEPVAYLHTLLGNLLLASGNVAGAATTYEAALKAFPGLPDARAGQAAVLAARGRAAQAAALMTAIVESQPRLEFAIQRADYYLAANMSRQAQQADELVDAIVALDRANGVDLDLDIAVHLADRRPTPQLLASVRRATKRRPSVTAYDALAWNLHRLGKHREASEAIDNVVTFGDRDPVKRFHAAAIAAANGDREAARTHLDIVLSTNPRAAGIRFDELQALARALNRTVPPPTK